MSHEPGYEFGFARIGLATTRPDKNGVRREYGIWERTHSYGRRLDTPAMSVQFEGTLDAKGWRQGLPSGPWTNSQCWWRQPFEKFEPKMYESVRYFNDDPRRADNTSA